MKKMSYKHIHIIVLECLPNSIRFGLRLSKSVVNLRVCEIPELTKLIMGGICDYLSCWVGCGAILQKLNGKYWNKTRSCIKLVGHSPENDTGTNHASNL